MARKRFSNKNVVRRPIPPGAYSRKESLPRPEPEDNSSDEFKWAMGDALVNNGVTFRDMNDAVDGALNKGRVEEVTETWEEVRGIDHAPFSPIPVPRELPNLRLHLLRRWDKDGVFARLPSLMDPTIDPKYEREVLKQASLWWVKDDMVELVLAAMPTIPADVIPTEITLPGGQDFGLMVLQKPWAGIDAMTGEVGSTKVHAMSWGPSIVQRELCVSYSMYNYIDFGLGMNRAEMQQAVEQGVLPEGHAEKLKRDQATGELAFLLRGGAWVFMGRSDWPISERLDSFHIEAKNNPLTDHRKASLEEDRRFFSAFCALVNHRLSNEEIIHPQRHVRRQAEREGVTAPSTVKYIRLREVAKKRKEEGDTEHTHREYSHRWFSRGHMGFRWCGPKDGERYRKLVYVNPSIKGPQDKPLVVKTEVRTWVR